MIVIMNKYKVIYKVYKESYERSVYTSNDLL